MCASLELGVEDIRRASPIRDDAETVMADVAFDDPGPTCSHRLQSDPVPSEGEPHTPLQEPSVEAGFLSCRNRTAPTLVKRGRELHVRYQLDEVVRTLSLSDEACEPGPLPREEAVATWHTGTW